MYLLPYQVNIVSWWSLSKWTHGWLVLLIVAINCNHNLHCAMVDSRFWMKQLRMLKLLNNFKCVFFIKKNIAIDNHAIFVKSFGGIICFQRYNCGKWHLKKKWCEAQWEGRAAADSLFQVSQAGGSSVVVRVMCSRERVCVCSLMIPSNCVCRCFVRERISRAEFSLTYGDYIKHISLI